MTVFVEKIRKPNVKAAFAVAREAIMIVSGLAVAQVACVFVVFSL